MAPKGNIEMKESICPICEEGRLIAKVEMDAAEYRGVNRELPLHFSECDTCESETATAEQTRDNKRGMIAFKKEVDGFLTGNEIVALRNRLGVTQAQAAKMYGGGPVAFSKYEKDDVTQSESMDKLLRVVDKFPMVAAWLAKEFGEDEVAARLRNERFPCFDLKPFVKAELKATAVASKEFDQFQYTKLEKGNPVDEEVLNVG